MEQPINFQGLPEKFSGKPSKISVVNWCDRFKRI
ncbi:hypothetical protein AYI69_g1606, partial [Smittium culicis]